MSTQDLKTLDIECLHGCLFALEEYTTLIAQRLARQLRGDPWMLLDAVGMLLVAPGCSWLVLGPTPCFSISPEVAPVCPGAVQSRRGGPCIK